MPLPPLYLITDPLLSGRPDAQSLFEAIESALEEGVRLIQYREKNRNRRQMYETAKRLRELTARCGATLIVNDEIDLALAVKADGVHLGQGDLPVWLARKVLGRKVLGKNAIIGISTHRCSEAIQAESDGADYIGIGPIFKTQTKQSSNPPLGLDTITEVRNQIQVPIFAIGGIRLSHIPDIIAAGADGIAVISSIAGDIRSNVKQAMTLLNTNSKHNPRPSEGK